MKTSLGAKTLALPTPVWVVATYDRLGKENGMTVAWGGICCSRPPCVCVALREATYTYGAILERKAFTVNVPSAKQVKIADFFGIASGRDVSKFSAAGLSATRSDLVDAPLIEEFPLNLECTLIHTLEIGLHTLFIGEILDVKADDSILNCDERLSITQLNPPVFSTGEAAYYETGEPLGKAFSIGKELE